MTSTETIFQNLYNLVSQAQLLVNGSPTGGNAFLTTGRTCPQVSNVGQALQPAMYIMEGEQDVMENIVATAKYELHCAVIVFFRNTLGPNAVYSTQLNNLRDAVIYQLQQQTLAANGTTVISLPGGSKQTLGGVVYHARVKGRILVNEGLQNNQGALVFPVSILSGM
jgi:hypothetical protein